MAHPIFRRQLCNFQYPEDFRGKIRESPEPSVMESQDFHYAYCQNISSRNDWNPAKYLSQKANPIIFPDITLSLHHCNKRTKRKPKLHYSWLCRAMQLMARTNRYDICSVSSVAMICSESVQWEAVESCNWIVNRMQIRHATISFWTFNPFWTKSVFILYGGNVACFSQMALTDEIIPGMETVGL